MHLDVWDYLAAAGAAGAAGTVNALAGGGTLISFPTLIALGVPAVGANVTNTVSLLPGYVGGSWAQREDLKPQMSTARYLAGVSAAGGLAGSILLVTIPAQGFRDAVPYLILLACGLLFFQNRLRPASADHPHPQRSVPLLVTVFAAAVYGGFFGAGMGIILMALLGLFTSEALKSVNALKQALSFVVNGVAAVFFAFTGHVVWELVPVMAAASVIGGSVGGRLVQKINQDVLRRVVVVAGVAVAVSFWVA